MAEETVAQWRRRLERAALEMYQELRLTVLECPCNVPSPEYPEGTINPLAGCYRCVSRRQLLTRVEGKAVRA